MKGDFSRLTFDPTKHYNSVRMQQGRPQLDADWNEQVAIQSYHAQTITRDLIGYGGVPASGGGFQIITDSTKTNLLISVGRIYVDGLACELPEAIVPIRNFIDDGSGEETAAGIICAASSFYYLPMAVGQWVSVLSDNQPPIDTYITSVVPIANSILISSTISNYNSLVNPRLTLKGIPYTDQPFYPNVALPQAPTQSQAAYLAYLDIWEQLVTALEDPSLRDIALGGADTATRTRILWRVKLLPVSQNDLATIDRDSFGPDWQHLSTQLDSRLTTYYQNTGGSELGNFLYRVEIHHSGGPYTVEGRNTAPAQSVASVQKDPSTITIQDPTNALTPWWSVIGQPLELFDSVAVTNNQLGLLTTVVEALSDIDTSSGTPVTIWTIQVADPVKTLIGASSIQARAIATFKWSRDNGSVAFPVAPYVGVDDATTLTIQPLSEEALQILRPADWIEVADEASWLQNLPGMFTQVQSVDLTHRTITVQPPVPVSYVQVPTIARRWDQQPASQGSLVIDNGLVGLEDGIVAQFSGSRFLTGDYWIFNTRAPQWIDLLTAARPQGITHQYYPLALLQQDTQNLWTTTDFRRVFRTITDLSDPLGIRVETVSYGNGTLLNNNAQLFVDNLNSSLQIAITCNASIAPEAIVNKPVCNVTLFMPIYQTSGNTDTPVIGYSPQILAGSANLSGSHQNDTNVIVWTSTPEAFSWLKTSGDIIQPVVAYLTLRGNFIWGQADPNLYLDGNVFGSSISPTGLTLPSGAGQAGGDFEMWFWFLPDGQAVMDVASSVNFAPIARLPLPNIGYETALPQSIVISNLGVDTSANINISHLTLTGDSVFSLSGNSVNNLTSATSEGVTVNLNIHIDQHETFTVNFNPPPTPSPSQRNKVYTGTLSIKYTATPKANLIKTTQVILQASVQDPDMSSSQIPVSTSSQPWNFGNVQWNLNKTNTFLVSNSAGQAPLTISIPTAEVNQNSFSMQFSNDFSFTTANNNNIYILPAGQQGSISVTFNRTDVQPSAPSIFDDTFHLTSNDPLLPTTTLYVRATRVLTPQLQVVGALSFGEVVLGLSKTLSVRLNNTGSTPITLATPTSNSPWFGNLQIATNPYAINTNVIATNTVDGGQSVYLWATFAPPLNHADMLQSISAAITVSGTANDIAITPPSLTATGTGKAPLLAIGLPGGITPVNFGNHIANTLGYDVQEKIITLSNTGNDTLTISNLQITTGPAYTIKNPDTQQYVTSLSNITIAASSYKVFALRFAPTTVGSQSGSLSITSNSLEVVNKINIVQLTGSGISAAVVRVTTPPMNTSYYTNFTWYFQQSGGPQTLRIKNFGSATSNNMRVYIDNRNGGSSVSDFHIVGDNNDNKTFNLSAGGYIDIQITISSRFWTDSGVPQADLIINSSDPAYSTIIIRMIQN